MTSETVVRIGYDEIGEQPTHDRRRNWMVTIRVGYAWSVLDTGREERE